MTDQPREHAAVGEDEQFATNALGDAMSAISERSYCAGWMIDCEYEIWRALTEPASPHGRWLLEDHDRWHLTLLSKEVGGWVRPSEDNEVDEYERIPMPQWREMYEAHCQKHGWKNPAVDAEGG